MESIREIDKLLYKGLRAGENIKEVIQNKYAFDIPRDKKLIIIF